MKRIIKSVCIDCSETKSAQGLDISSIVEILDLYNIYIRYSYDEDSDIICLKIKDRDDLKIKRGSYLVLYDDKTKEFLSGNKYREKIRMQRLNDYSMSWENML